MDVTGSPPRRSVARCGGAGSTVAHAARSVRSPSAPARESRPVGEHRSGGPARQRSRAGSPLASSGRVSRRVPAAVSRRPRTLRAPTARPRAAHPHRGAAGAPAPWSACARPEWSLRWKAFRTPDRAMGDEEAPLRITKPRVVETVECRGPRAGSISSGRRRDGPRRVPPFRRTRSTLRREPMCAASPRDPDDLSLRQRPLTYLPAISRFPPEAPTSSCLRRWPNCLPRHGTSRLPVRSSSSGRSSARRAGWGAGGVVRAGVHPGRWPTGPRGSEGDGATWRTYFSS